MENLQFAAAYEMAAAIRSRRVSVQEVIEAHLEQIARHNPSLNAIIALDEEGARKRARVADEAIAQGQMWGPLHGVPYTLKDVHDTAGLPSTMGAPFLKDRTATEDSDVAARLKAAGGILLGKTNAQLFPDNPFGRTRNPWNLERTAASSSSGSAAAIAAGFSPLDIGSDLNGSLIVPCSFTGTFGMRPTERRVPVGWFPTDEHPIWRNMGVNGPMARCVEDLYLALQVIAGPSRRESVIPPVPLRGMPHLTLAGLKIAWTATFPGASIAEDIGAAIESLVQKLDRQGAVIQECLPEVDLAVQTKMSDRAFEIVVGAYADPPALLGDYFTLLHERETIIASWEEFLSDWDVFLCPAERYTAPQNEQWGVMKPEPIEPASLSGVTGQPDVIIPIGKDRDGMPIGVQLMGKRWEDERLLAIAERISDVTDGFQRPPGY